MIKMCGLVIWLLICITQLGSSLTVKGDSDKMKIATSGHQIVGRVPQGIHFPKTFDRTYVTRLQYPIAALLSITETVSVFPHDCVRICQEDMWEYSLIKLNKSGSIECFCGNHTIFNPPIKLDTSLLAGLPCPYGHETHPCGSPDHYSVYCNNEHICNIPHNYKYWACISPCTATPTNNTFAIHSTTRLQCLDTCSHNYNVSIVDSSSMCRCAEVVEVSSRDIRCDCDEWWCPPLAGPCGSIHPNEGQAVYCRGDTCDQQFTPAKYHSSKYQPVNDDEDPIEFTVKNLGPKTSSRCQNRYSLDKRRAGDWNYFPKHIQGTSIIMALVVNISEQILGHEDCIFKCKEYDKMYAFYRYDSSYSACTCLCGNSDSLHTSSLMPDVPSWLCIEPPHGYYEVYCTGRDNCNDMSYIYWGTVTPDRVNMSKVNRINIGSSIQCLHACASKGHESFLMSTGSEGTTCLCNVGHTFSINDLECPDRWCVFWCPPMNGPCCTRSYGVYCKGEICEKLLNRGTFQNPSIEPTNGAPQERPHNHNTSLWISVNLIFLHYFRIYIV